MFTPPPAWASSVLVPAVSFENTASSRWNLKSICTYAIIAILLTFISSKCYRHAFKTHKHRRLQRSWDRFQPMRAVVVPRTPPKPRSRSRQAVWVPPSPESSPSPEFTPSPSPQLKPPSCLSTPSQNVPYIAVPRDFPRGPRLVLTRPQLRFAFYFSPKDRRVVDPDAKYWCGGHGTTLRTEFWGLIFDRNFALKQMINGNVCETRFGFPEWVLRSNIGSDWPSKALYFEDPTKYTSKGKLRQAPLPSIRRSSFGFTRDEFGQYVPLPNEKKRPRFDDDDEWAEIE